MYHGIIYLTVAEHQHDWTPAPEIDTGCFQLQRRKDRKNERMFTNPIKFPSLS